LRALLQLSHLFGTDMRDRKQGRILNVCATSAFLPLPNLASYAASKAFVLSLSEAMSIENAAYGVTVTALCPGFVATEMTQKAGDI
jgi:short-subunit dehydrogenase